MSERLLITDLDNTLYDWVTFFAKSFQALVQALVSLLGVSKEQLLDEFQAIHREHGSPEYPFAAMELPSVQKQFGNLSRVELKQKLDEPLHVFNSTRNRYLVLYDSVRTTLDELAERNVSVVGLTDAMEENAYFRLSKLGIDHYFKRLYTLDVQVEPHPDPIQGKTKSAPPDFVKRIQKSEGKPNPKLLLDVCQREGFLPSRTWYVGDSLVQDISMAKAAKIVAVWARYGTQYDSRLRDLLVRVTHWTKSDVKRDTEYAFHHDELRPDHSIDSFGEILGLFDEPTQPITI